MSIRKPVEKNKSEQKAIVRQQTGLAALSDAIMQAGEHKRAQQEADSKILLGDLADVAELILVDDEFASCNPKPSGVLLQFNQMDLHSYYFINKRVDIRKADMLRLKDTSGEAHTLSFRMSRPVTLDDYYRFQARVQANKK